jgi:phosphatidate phosphatase PAH1
MYRNESERTGDFPEKKRDAKANKKSMSKQTSFGDSILKNSSQNSDSSPTSSKRKTRGLGKKTLQRQSTINQDTQLTLIKQKTTTVGDLTCKCSKSKCLKMYCECFTQGRYCDKTCSCIGCSNTPENVEKIKNARKNIRQRNPQAFKPKV